MDNEYVTKKMGGAKLLIKKKPEKKKIRKGKNKQTGVNVDKKSYESWLAEGRPRPKVPLLGGVYMFTQI